MPDAELRALTGELAAELKKLRKGAGLYSPDLPSKTGPRLNEILELSAEVDTSVLRGELWKLLNSAVVALPTERRRGALIALGLSRTHAEKNLGERMADLARQADRDLRTMQRWVDSDHAVMAAVLADRLTSVRGRDESHVQFGWNVEQLSSSLVFGPGRPVLVERREIVVTDPEISMITANLTLGGDAGPDDVPTVTAGEGCAVRDVRTLGGKFWSFDLAFPRVIRCGESWTYEVTFEFPRRGVMAPFYGFMPLRRSRHFAAEVTFTDPDEVAAIYALLQVPQIVIEDAGASAAAGTPMALTDGTARFECSDLRQGFCYGLRWVWAAGPVGGGSGDVAGPSVE